MPPASVENHAAFIVEHRVRPGEISPKVEGFEPRGVAAGREFRHHLVRLFSGNI